MLTKEKIFEQAQQAISLFVEYSLSIEQNFPALMQNGKDDWQITIGKANGYSIAMRNISYKDIYESLAENKLFAIKMIDGALIQMLYRFQKNTLSYHRLAFFPSPNLEEYQNNSEIYELDEIYADILMKEIVPFPIRFDFDSSDAKHIVCTHPKSHLTLGQYMNCRIPVSAPLTPYLFLNFILRNFYNTAFCKFLDVLKFNGDVFDENIHDDERNLPHIMLPISRK